MSEGFFHAVIVPEEAVYPVGVSVRTTGTRPRVRAARRPLMYSWREFLTDCGTGAAQRFSRTLTLCQPVMRTPPLRIGRSSGAALRLRPASAAVRRRGAVSR